MTATTMGLVGAGLLWTSFESGPPQALELKAPADGEARPGRTPEAREWEAVLDRGDVIEGRIPRTSQGLRTATLFEKSAKHRMLADLARMQIQHNFPRLSVGRGPGVAVPLDRLEVRAEKNGDLYVVFISPLGELKSQTPIARDELFEGATLVVNMGPLTIEGEGGAKASVDAVAQLRFDASEARFDLRESVIRIRVRVPALLVDTSDETSLPPLSAPLSPSKLTP